MGVFWSNNLLIPVDAEVHSESDVEYEAVDAGRILGKMKEAGNKLNIVIFDACRNNPFARSFRSSSQGLAKMDAPMGTIIAYATSPDSVAASGIGVMMVRTVRPAGMPMWRIRRPRAFGQIGRFIPAMMGMRFHPQLAPSVPMAMGCMTCWAMSGSGVRTGTEGIIMHPALVPIPRVPPLARTAWIAGAAGTTTRGLCVRRPAAGTARPSATSTSVSGCFSLRAIDPGRSQVRQGAEARCDRHGHELIGESPVIALERREYVDEGKGARRNFHDLPEEG
jgi:hypothetical protein